jgi:hypothetical protein
VSTDIIKNIGIYFNFFSVYTVPTQAAGKGEQMPITQAQLKAGYKYDKENTTQIRLKLNNKTDRDILAKLDTVQSKQGYIKALIRADLDKIGKE